MHGTHRGDFAKSIKHADPVIAPKSNLSFADNRSVNALPFSGNGSDKTASALDRGLREPQTRPKVIKPNNYNQGFQLASPEDFLAQPWAGKTGKNTSGKILHEGALGGKFDQIWKPMTVVDNIPGIEMRTPTAIPAVSPVLIGVHRPPERATSGNMVDSSNGVAYSTSVQVAIEIGGKVVMIDTGTVCIKAVGQSSNLAKIIQVDISGKTYIEEPLLENFDFKLDLCTLSFYSGFEANQTKWILTASQPEIAADLAEAFERLKPRSICVGLVDAPAEGHADKVEERESLISFSDQDSMPPQAVSQFTEDLFSLMGAEFIADAVNAINSNIGQNSATEVESGILSTREAESTEAQQKTSRGLATSLLANQVEVSDFLNRSAIFQKLPGITAEFIKAQLSKGILDGVQKDICEQEVFKPVKQQSRQQYSVEALISLRNQPSAKKPSRLDPCVESTPKSESRHIFRCPELEHIAIESLSLPISETTPPSNSCTTRLGVSNVSGRETPRKPLGLAASKYASAHIAVAGKESTKLKEQKPSASPKEPDPRALGPIQGLSASKYTSPTEHSEIKKPRSSDSQENQPPRPIISQIFPISGQPGSSYVKPLPEPSPSNHSKAASSKPLKELSIQDLRDPLGSKPFQGLASSKYASPNLTMPSAMKTNLSVTAQGFPKIPNFIAASPMTKVVVPDLKDEIAKEGRTQDRDAADDKAVAAIFVNREPFPQKAGSWNTLRRRDSFNSHASNDSTETVKPPPQPAMQRVQNNAAPIHPLRVASGHQSILSMGSSVSCESFATAIEEMSTAGGAVGGNSRVLVDLSQPYGVQTGTFDFVLFPDDKTGPEAPTKELGPKLPYSSGISELMGQSMPAAAQTDPSDLKLAFSFKSGSTTENVAPKPPILELESNTRPTVLKPTASQFTPSASPRITGSACNATNPFPLQVQPVMATVFVHDPQNPGMLIEVSGLLKMGSTPIVGFVAAHDSPMGEVLTSGATLGTFVSPQRAPLTPVVQKVANTKNRQEEIQERLTKSLTKRRPSQSPGHVSF